MTEKKKESKEKDRVDKNRGIIIRCVICMVVEV
jgi:hypothetical protein